MSSPGRLFTITFILIGITIIATLQVWVYFDMIFLPSFSLSLHTLLILYSSLCTPYTHFLVLQSAVIAGVISTRDVSLSQLQSATNMLDGLNVGVVAGSVEEWRMRARGANVTL